MLVLRLKVGERHVKTIKAPCKDMTRNVNMSLKPLVEAKSIAQRRSKGGAGGAARPGPQVDGGPARGPRAYLKL